MNSDNQSTKTSPSISKQWEQLIVTMMAFSVIVGIAGVAFFGRPVQELVVPGAFILVFGVPFMWNRYKQRNPAKR